MSVEIVKLTSVVTNIKSFCPRLCCNSSPASFIDTESHNTTFPPLSTTFLAHVPPRFLEPLAIRNTTFYKTPDTINVITVRVFSMSCGVNKKFCLIMKTNEMHQYLEHVVFILHYRIKVYAYTVNASNNKNRPLTLTQPCGNGKNTTKTNRQKSEQW